MDYAYQFVISNHGIDTEDDYPYQGRDGSCRKDKVIQSISPSCFPNTFTILINHDMNGVVNLE